MVDFFDEQKKPVDKFYEILCRASGEVVRQELDKLISRLIALELFVEKEEELDLKLAYLMTNREEEMEEEKQNLYLDLMSQILRKTTY